MLERDPWSCCLAILPLGKEVREPGSEALPRSLVAAEEMMGLADRLGDLFRVYPWGSWISQPGKNSALWFWGVVGSAVVICFLSVPEEKDSLLV